MTRVGIWRCLLLVLLLSGCVLSAPPPERGGAPMLTPLAASPEVRFELPSRKPSVSNGAAIYGEKCVTCHGAAGKGDGQQAAAIRSEFGAPPADLTADGVARVSTPAEWFGVLTQGRLERGMPPFSGSLSVDDRWDVIAYVWSLSASESELAAGRAIYEARCVQCHGEAGRGNGPQSDGSVPDLSDLAAHRDVAPGEWDILLDTAHVPSFSGKLGSPERSAVIDYVRSFAYQAAAEAPPTSTADTATIQIDALHVIVRQGGDTIEVVEIYVLSNAGDRVVVNAAGPTLRFALPAGASGLRLLDGAAPDAVVEAPGGFDYAGAVPPGNGTLSWVVGYHMPLGAADVVFDRAMAYPVGSINLLAQAGDLSVSSDRLFDEGLRDIEGQSYRHFSGGPFQAGHNLTFRLVRPITVDVQLLAGIALLVVGVTAAGYGLWRRRERDAAKADRERLIDAIAALDDAFEAGEMAEAEYRKRRRALKAKALRST